VEKEKRQKFAEYVQSIAAIEECMKPYRDQRKDLRRNFVENRWLSREEASMAVKAFRMWEQQINFEDLTAIYESIETSFAEKEVADEAA
tara:strand:+ start:332 stop:598 length:267 start_codon:yes stop_codon:yes gene_type:complete